MASSAAGAAAGGGGGLKRSVPSRADARRRRALHGADGWGRTTTVPRVLSTSRAQTSGGGDSVEALSWPTREMSSHGVFVDVRLFSLRPRRSTRRLPAARLRLPRFSNTPRVVAVSPQVLFSATVAICGGVAAGMSLAAPRAVPSVVATALTASLLPPAVNSGLCFAFAHVGAPLVAARADGGAPRSLKDDYGVDQALFDEIALSSAVRRASPSDRRSPRRAGRGGRAVMAEGRAGPAAARRHGFLPVLSCDGTAERERAVTRR